MLTLAQQAIFTANALDNIVRKCKEDWGPEDASPCVLQALAEHAKDLRALVIPEDTYPLSYGWNIMRGDGGAWSINCCEPHEGMALLRTMFPDASRINCDNFVLFSTSGVHGSYATIEDCAEYFFRTGLQANLTFVIVAPRILRLAYGNCQPVTRDDFDYLKAIREASHETVAKIGVPR